MQLVVLLSVYETELKIEQTDRMRLNDLTTTTKVLHVCRETQSKCANVLEGRQAYSQCQQLRCKSVCFAGQASDWVSRWSIVGQTKAHWYCQVATECQPNTIADDHPIAMIKLSS
ncbi:Proteasome subunit alpha [Trichinella spiralis]